MLIRRPVNRDLSFDLPSQMLAITGERMLKQTICLGLTCFLVSGCLTRDEEIYARGVIDGPRVVAMSGPRDPWIAEIEKRLRAKGFQVKRFESVTDVAQRTSPTRVEVSFEATARVVVRVEGRAPRDAMRRCFGGGFNFDYINAEVIDMKNNETLASYSNSGYSEGCQPLSKSIYSDIVNMIEMVFKQSSATIKPTPSPSSVT